MAFWKESMINRLSNLINRNRSAAKISQVLCSNCHAHAHVLAMRACVWIYHAHAQGCVMHRDLASKIV